MIKEVKDKMVEHIKATNKLSEAELEEVEKIFDKHSYPYNELDPSIFYCEDCKQNNIYTPTKSWMSGKYFHYHPKCPICKKGMKRIVINQIKVSESFKDFIRKPRPKIFCFISAKGFIKETDVIVSALAEDGEGIVGSHLSSNKLCGKMDIGLLTKTHHKEYSKKYPEGFELIWIGGKEQDTNEDFLKAYNLNKQKCEMLKK